MGFFSALKDIALTVADKIKVNTSKSRILDQSIKILKDRLSTCEEASSNLSDDFNYVLNYLRNQNLRGNLSGYDKTRLDEIDNLLRQIPDHNRKIMHLQNRNTYNVALFKSSPIEYQSYLHNYDNLYSQIKKYSNVCGPLKDFCKDYEASLKLLKKVNDEITDYINKSLSKLDIADIIEPISEQHKKNISFMQYDIDWKNLYSKYYDALIKINKHNDVISSLMERNTLNVEQFNQNPIENIDYLNSYKSLYYDIKKYKDPCTELNNFIKAFEACQEKLKDYENRINDYVDKQTVLLHDFTLLTSIDSELEQIIEDMRKVKGYETLLEKYDNFKKEADNHDAEVNKLQNLIDSINLEREDILKEPKKFKDIDFDAINAFAKTILGYKAVPKRYKEKLNNINFAKDNLDEIIKQFELYHECLKQSKQPLKDKYYDTRDINDDRDLVLNTIKSLNGKELFYDFNSLIREQSVFEQHNKEFINSHINDTFFDNIDGKSLDKSQRIAVLTNPISELTVAGAGSGKTLTICAKVKYLLDNNLAKPEDILLLTYSKNSSEDLAKRINKISNDIKVSTFHSLGLKILEMDENKKQCIDDQGLTRCIHQYFDQEMYSKPKMAKKIFTYYALFLQDADFNKKKYKSKGERFEDLKKEDLKTLKAQLKEISDKDNKKTTLNHEHVKSYEELIIANFYFINGVKYEYEKSYKEKDTATNKYRQYCPDFTILQNGVYHEHYGIDEEGRATQYCEEEEKEYLASLNWKRYLHKTRGSRCIETYSYQFTNGTIFHDIVKAWAKYGIKTNPLTNEDIKNVMNSIYQGRSFESFIKLLSTFINLYKARYRNELAFDELKNRVFDNNFEKGRATMFLDIAKDIYVYYMNHLRSQKKIDFDDMIIMAKDRICDLNQFKYKYVIVDEFQDISYSRMEFLNAVIKHGDAKLYAVGDDWQAIYRFSGCDLNIFLKFKDYFKDAEVNNIDITHRNAQEIQDIVEPFIEKNPEQYKKHINSNIHINNPINLCVYNESKIGALIKAVSLISKQDKKANVLILGRNNKDLDLIIEDTRLIKKDKAGKVTFKDYPDLNATYKTVHASKGLESDYVVLINADDSKYGFPNKVEDDPLLSLVLSDKSSYEFAEERRLWYVALTRTKKKTYILVNQFRESIFVKEIKNKCNIIECDIVIDKNPMYCPHCKTGKMVLRENPTDGKQFYGCSNYPYCTYTCNDLDAVEKQIKCPDCGYYLERHHGKYGYFKKCSNKQCKYSRRDSNFEIKVGEMDEF